MAHRTEQRPAAAAAERVLVDNASLGSILWSFNKSMIDISRSHPWIAQQLHPGDGPGSGRIIIHSKLE